MMKINSFESGFAPEIEAEEWLNTSAPLSLNNLRGKVVVIHAFQMLCPGCVLHGIPQTSAIHEMYSQEKNVQVIGLHSVFEHHTVMDIDALKAFVHEYQLPFPIAVDKPSESNAIPVTMQKFSLKGTPSLILVDKKGRIRLNHFGRLSDMEIGYLIGMLLHEEREDTANSKNDSDDPARLIQPSGDDCDENGCG